MKPLLDVVIPVHGQFDLLEATLNAIVDHPNIKIILSDDASPNKDEAGAFYAKLAQMPKIKVIRNRTNRGFAATVNEGVRAGKSPLILLLNSDCVLDPNAIDNAFALMGDPSVGVLGGLLTFPDNSRWGHAGKVQHAGIAFGITGFPFHIHLGWSPDHPRVQQPKVLQAVTGACFFTRRALWNSVNGMSTDYGLGTYEDIEYCFRALERKLKVLYHPSVRGVHHVGASIVASERKYPMQHNQQIFRERWKVFWDEYRLW